jgi:hypothetical protein
MAKQKTYTVPLTLRMTPMMLEYVRQQAHEKGITVVDWIRFAVAFTYWEEGFVRNYERLRWGWKPGDHHPETSMILTISPNLVRCATNGKTRTLKPTWHNKRGWPDWRLRNEARECRDLASSFRPAA